MEINLEPSVDGGMQDAMNEIAGSIKNTDANPNSSLNNNPESGLADVKVDAPAKKVEEEKPSEEKVEDIKLEKEFEESIDNKKASDFLDEEVEKNKPEPVEEYDEDELIAVEIAREAKKAGKSIIDFIESIKGENIDKLSPRELFMKDLDRYPELSEDERNLELENFDGMSKLQQLKAIEPIKTELKNSQKDLLKRFTTTNVQKQEQFKAHVAQEAQKAYTELDSLLSEKEYKNFELTPERAKAIKKHVEQNLNHEKDGSFNVKKGINSAIMDLYENEFLNANRNVAKMKERERLFKENSRISKESHSFKPPEGKNEQESLSKAQNEFFERQLNKNNLNVI